MKKSTGILLALASLFFGVIIGFVFSPIKHGLNIGNDSGNTNNYNSGAAKAKCSPDADDENDDCLEF